MISVARFDIDGNSSMVLAYDSMTVIVYNATLYPIANFSTSGNFNITAGISNVKFVRYPFIAILTNDNVLREFDYFEIQKIITHQNPFGVAYTRIDYMQGVDQMLVCQELMSAYLYRVINNGSYFCDGLGLPDGLLSCGSCLANYTLDAQGQC